MIQPIANCSTAPALRRLAPRLARRLWLGLVVLAAGGLVVAVVSHVPLRTRIAFGAGLLSRLSSAPVLAIGDSIAYQSAPHSLCGEDVLNAAVPGDRLDDLLARAPALAARLSPARVVVAVGVNDSARPHSDIAGWTARYRALLAHFSVAALVLVEVNPVDATHSPYVARLDQDFIAAQNAAIRAVAAETGAVVVAAPRAVTTRDGLHPTRAGALLWRARLSSAACR